MARFNPIQNSFVAGEISPRLEGRDDLEQYFQALRQALNGVVLPHGGFMRRSGSRFVARVKDQSKAVRLVPFIFSTVEKYVVEFGEDGTDGGYARFYANEGQLLDAGHSVTAVDTGAKKFTISGDRTSILRDGDFVEVTGSTGNDGQYTVASAVLNGSDTDVTVDEAVPDATADGNMKIPVEVSTPYLEAEVATLQGAQSADTMWVDQENHHPHKLERTSATAFTFSRVAWRDGKAPLRPENLSATTLTISGSGPYTLTWSADIGLTTADDVGRAVRVNDTEQVWFEITAVTDGQTATADKKSGTVPGTPSAVTDWALGMYSDTEGAFAVSFHEGRLGHFGSAGEPDRFSLSVSDDFDNYEIRDPSLTDAENADKAVARRAVGGRVDAIRWAASSDDTLVVGTTGAEHRVTGENQDLLEPLSAKVRKSTGRGSAHVEPILIDGSVYFVQRNSRKVRKWAFEVVQDRFGAQDISILAEHVLDDGGGKELAYQQDPDSVVWVVRGDGTLVGFTVEQEQRVIGAHRHQFGGSFLGGIAEVESMAVIPEPGETEDQLWVVVKRTIDGSTTRYVEFVEDQFRPTLTPKSSDEERRNALDDAFFVDSGLSLDDPLGGGVTDVTNASPAVVTTASAHGLSNGDRLRLRGVRGGDDSDGVDTLAGAVNQKSFKAANVASTTLELQDLDGNDVDTSSDTAYVTGGTLRKEVQTVSGADHLEGETVQVLADGAAHPDKTVSGGNVTLDRWASIVHLGLGFKTEGETQRLTGGGRLGTDQGQQMRVQRVVVRVHNTLGIDLGVGSDPADADLDSPLFRSGSDTPGRPPPLFTGDLEVPVRGGWQRGPTLYFRQVQPLPMTVLAAMPRAESGER